MNLEPRLQTAAEYIRASIHADIGSDHAKLPKYLLESGRVERVIVVEKNQGPWENSRQALQGLRAEVRLGDGVGALASGEVDSLSMTGMGAKRMVRILSAEPEKLPTHLVLQPNDSPLALRRWATGQGFHLLAEQMVEGYWYFTVLSLKRHSGPDPAYNDMPLEGALRYGPWLLKQKHPLLLQHLSQTQQHLTKQIQKQNAEVLRDRLKMVEKVLGLLLESNNL